MTDAADASLSLRAAADELGVHYMTVYRYVRTGRLPAVKVGGEWRVERADLEAAAQGGPVVESGTRGRFRARLSDRLLAADEAGAWNVVESALASGAGPAEVYLRLLIPVMQDIGRRWEQGELSVLDEHQATAVATRLVGRLGPRFRHRGRRRGLVLVGAVAGDTHALAPALLADLVRDRGFDAVDLGADTPVESFAEAATGADGLVAVLVSCSTPTAVPAVAATVASLRAAGCGAPILAGGVALGPQAARRLGADGGGSTASEALDLLDRLTGGAAAG
jgi:excisionase family DNA binding protein